MPRRAAWRVSLGAAVAVGVLTASSVAFALPAGETHLPDLRARKAGSLMIQRSSGSRVLRLTTTIWNAGPGRLQLEAQNADPTTQTWEAWQRLYTHDGAGTWVPLTDADGFFPIGTFAYHSAHGHWHFGNESEGFARYALHAVASDGSIGAVVRSSDKVTFCVIDTSLASSTVQHAESAKHYTSCSQGAAQGLSVGWADTYPYYVAGQAVDLTGLPSTGTYWLVNTADPQDLIAEANETNNASAVKIRIRRSRVTILS